MKLTTLLLTLLFINPVHANDQQYNFVLDTVKTISLGPGTPKFLTTQLRNIVHQYPQFLLTEKDNQTELFFFDFLCIWITIYKNFHSSYNFPKSVKSWNEVVEKNNKISKTKKEKVLKILKFGLQSLQNGGRKHSEVLFFSKLIRPIKFIDYDKPKLITRFNGKIAAGGSLSMGNTSNPFILSSTLVLYTKHIEGFTSFRFKGKNKKYAPIKASLFHYILWGLDGALKRNELVDKSLFSKEFREELVLFLERLENNYYSPAEEPSLKQLNFAKKRSESILKSLDSFDDCKTPLTE